MPLSPLEIARRHQQQRTKLASAGTVKALKLWKTVNPQRLDVGWTDVAERLVLTVTAAQIQAAEQSAGYMDRVSTVYGGSDTAEIVPQAFGGVGLDGREIGPAMFGAVTTTKEATKLVGATRAFEVGASFLATVVGAAIQDMGRQADSTLAVGRGFTRYVRVINPGACSRCAVLAGSESFSATFLRHPRCKCTQMPVHGFDDAPKGFFGSPDDYFESLAKSEQDRVFTKSGAEAIRNGADPVQVVNARRGAYGIGYSGHYNTPVSGNRLQKLTIGRRADGTPLQVYATTEGTTARGRFGRRELALTEQFTKEGRYRRTTTLRLMPEQISAMAGDDPARWRELLQKYGYLR